MKHSLIYVTVSSKDEAKKIGKVLVEKRLVACVNIIDGMTSMYWWDGKINEENEVVLIAKTRIEHVTSLINRVKELHSYDCPCVLSLPIENGNPEFLEWIDRETSR